MHETSYKMKQDEYNTVWITLGPLINDVKQIVDNANNIDTSEMTEEEKKGVLSTRVCTQAVYQFLSSLNTEFIIRNMMEKDNADKK